VKVYFVRATILILATVSTINAADDPCPNSYDQTTPISNQRSSGTMTINHLLCEQSDVDLTVENFQNYENLGLRVRNKFCSQFSNPTNTQSNSGVCNSKDQFNFTKFGEHFSTFVSNLSADLDALIPKIPASFENSEYSREEVKALMYLCTQYQLEKNKNILKMAGSEEEKERALENLAKLNLLTHFFETDEGKEFLANPDHSKEFRIMAFKKYLERAGENKELVLDMLENIKINLEEYSSISPDELEDYEKVDLEMSRIAVEAMKDYIQSPSNEQSPLALDLMAQAKIPGAQEALSRLQQQVTTSYPKCEDISLDDFDERSYRQSYNRISNALLEIGGDSSPFNTPAQDKWKWYQNFFALENNPDWFQLELRMKQGPYGDNDLKTLNQHYCFYQKLEGDIGLFKSLDGNSEVASSLANKIFDQINELGAGNEFLSLIKELYPHLNNENKLKAIRSIKLATGGTVEDQQLNQWRLNTLKEWIGPYNGDYSSPLAREIITATSYRGSVKEEAFLSELFVNAKEQEDKMFILNRYSTSTLVKDTAGNLKIIEAIASEKDSERRAQYLSELGTALSRVGVYGESKANLATDTIGKVGVQTMQQTLRKMIDLSTNTEVTMQLNKQIYDSIEAVNGVVSNTPENGDSLPVVKPIIKGDATSLPNNIGVVTTSGSFAQNKKAYNIDRRDSSTFKEKTLNQTGGYKYKSLSTAPTNSLVVKSGDQEPSPSANIFGDNQNNFLSDVNQALGLAPSGTSNTLQTPPLYPAPLAPSIGEDSSKIASTKDTFSNSLERGTKSYPSSENESNENQVAETNSSASSKSRGKSKRNSNQDIIDEIRQISQDTSNLKREIDELNGPTNPLFPTPSQVAQTQNQQDSPSSESESSGSGNFNNDSRAGQNQGRNIASSNQAGGSQNNSLPQENLGASNTEVKGNPFGQGLLAPYDDPTREDLDKVIKITSQEEKILLMNYMAANNDMSCPELRFIKQFYDENVNKFMMSSSRREYALLELDGMNFRFNYPGTGSLRTKIQETCANLADRPEAKSLGQGARAPASISSEIEEENQSQKDLVPSEAKPATKPQNLMKKFMLKLGL
jgi:hypothetical protein